MKDEKVNLVNCLTNHPLKRQTMCKFWKGFESLDGRPKDKEGKPIILKVKDWPEHDGKSTLTQFTLCLYISHESTIDETLRLSYYQILGKYCQNTLKT